MPWPRVSVVPMRNSTHTTFIINPQDTCKYKQYLNRNVRKRTKTYEPQRGNVPSDVHPTQTQISLCIMRSLIRVSVAHIKKLCIICYPKCLALRKQAYSNILKILPPKNEKFQIKILIFFLFSAQNIDCGYSLEPPRRGGSNEYP